MRTFFPLSQSMLRQRKERSRNKDLRSQLRIELRTSRTESRANPYFLSNLIFLYLVSGQRARWPCFLSLSLILQLKVFIVAYLLAPTIVSYITMLF